MNSDEYIRKIEEDVLQIIEDKLKNHQMNATRAKEIARFILEALHSHMSMDEIYSTVQKFDDHFSELIPVVSDVSQEYEAKINNAIVSHVGELVKQGRLDDAYKLLKKQK